MNNMSKVTTAVEVLAGDNSTAALDVERVREDFPILRQLAYGRPLVYLDNAASAQKPRQVLDAMQEAYETYYSNVPRAGVPWAAAAATPTAQFLAATAILKSRRGATIFPGRSACWGRRRNWKTPSGTRLERKPTRHLRRSSTQCS